MEKKSNLRLEIKAKRFIKFVVKKGNVEAMLAAGYDINCKITEITGMFGTKTAGRSCLSFACQNKYIEAIKIMLEQGADPNLMDDGRNELHIACKYGWLDIVILLLPHIKDINAIATYKPSIKGTALEIACKEKNVQIAKILIEHGADTSLVLLKAGKYSSSIKNLLQTVVNEPQAKITKQNENLLLRVVTRIQERTLLVLQNDERASKLHLSDEKIIQVKNCLLQALNAASSVTVLLTDDQSSSVIAARRFLADKLKEELLTLYLKANTTSLGQGVIDGLQETIILLKSDVEQLLMNQIQPVTNNNNTFFNSQNSQIDSINKISSEDKAKISTTTVKTADEISDVIGNFIPSNN